MRLTQLCTYKGNTWQMELDGSGELYFVHVSVVQHCGLQKGMELSAAQWKRVQDLETFRKAYQYSRYLLDNRGYSYQEMFRKLSPKYPENVCYGVVNRLVKNGMLNDWKYAEQAALHYIERKRFGMRRAYQEMRRRGLLDPQIQAALEPYRCRTEEILEELVRGKFVRYFAEPSDRKMIEKGKAALVRQGYTFGEIQRVVSAYLQEQKTEQESMFS